MIAALRQSLRPLCSPNSSYVRDSHWGFQILVPLLNFSTSVEGQSTVYQFLVQKHHFSPESASQIASVVTRLRDPAGSDSLLSFLKESGFSNAHLEKTFKCWPQFLSRSLDNTVLPRYKIFQEFGLSATDMAEIISKDPWILNQSINKRIIPSLTLLSNLFGANDLGKLLQATGAVCFFRANLDKTLVPNVEFLKNCGVSVEQMIWMLYYFPRFLLRKPEDMKKFVDKVDKIGVSRNSNQFIRAVRVVSSLSDKTLELKLRNLREVGFLDDDIVAVFRKSPTVFNLSEKRTKEAVEVLLANGKYDRSSIIANPICLMRSIEKRYKPRLRVLELLEDKKLIHRWPGLSRLGTMTDQVFYAKYVSPFLEEIGDVYMVKSPDKAI